MADKDQAQDQAQQKQGREKAQAKNREKAENQGVPGPDGAALAAREDHKHRARAQGEEVNEDYVAFDHESAQEKGYLGYAPSGPGTAFEQGEGK